MKYRSCETKTTVPLNSCSAVEQHVLGAHVEVVGGLVEQKKISRHHEHAGERVAVALAAREHADALENVVFGKQETAQNAAQFGIVGARRDLPRSSRTAASGSSALY